MTATATLVADIALTLIRTALSAELEVRGVSARVKTRESAREKAARKGVDVAELSDILGLRITTFDDEDIPRAVEVLRATLEVSEEVALPVDLARSTGYRSVFLVGRLPGSLAPAGAAAFEFEVQVHSLLGESLDQLAHLYRYKVDADEQSLRSRAREDVRLRHQELATRFRQLLDAEPSEEEIQRFLAEHPIFLEPGGRRFISKHRLGAEHVTDFVVELGAGKYCLIEIEPSKFRLFTKNGDPSKHLTHAQRQVEDWRTWVHEHLDYARRGLPEISDPACRVIIGRSSPLSDRDRKALARRNNELHHVSIETYDDLIERVENYVANL